MLLKYICSSNKQMNRSKIKYDNERKTQMGENGAQRKTFTRLAAVLQNSKMLFFVNICVIRILL